MPTNQSPFAQIEFTTQEEKLFLKKKKGKLNIGLPKEDFTKEKRICLTPDAVHMLIKNGHEIMVESSAGLGANYSDNDYSEAGATIVYSKEEIFNCPVIIKMLPPTLEELNLIKPKTYIFSALQLQSQKKEFFETITKKKITAIGYEHIKDLSGNYPVLHAISEMAGIASIHIAAELLSKKNRDAGILLGNISGISPTEIVIIGAGVVAEFAAKTALGLGAQVRIFDYSIHKLARISKNLNQFVATSIITEKDLSKALKHCDVAIGAIKGCNRSPIVATEEMVQQMKNGSVIIDVCIDNGGCFETSEMTTHENPTKEKYGVLHYAVPNITSKYAKTASIAISNIIFPMLSKISESGSIDNALEYDAHFREGVYAYQGILVNESVGKWFGLPVKDLNLLFLR